LTVDSRAILFLGAGASRALGFPTTKEFLDRFTAETLTSSTNSKDIMTGLHNVDGVRDIEYVLQILDDVLQTERTSIKRLFSKYPPNFNLPQGRGWGWNDFASAVSKLVDEIRDAVYRYYEFDPSLENKAVSYYDPIFAILREVDGRDIPVFTTNYDKVIEMFVNAHSDYDLVDGFVSARRGALPEWTPDVFQTTQSSNILVKLFKLHGSLDWRIRKSDGVPVKVDQAEERVNNSRKFEGNALIYPAGKDAPITEPFSSLHAYFRKYALTCSQIIVIGFAFRMIILEEYS
jgi:hypothetical protein